VFSNSQRAGQMSPTQINQLLNVLRQSGTSEAQLNQLRQTLQSGQQIPANQLMQLLTTAARGGPSGRGVQPAQVTALVNNLASSGLMTQQQATQINQQVAQMGNQQVNNIIRQIQQPPPPPAPPRPAPPAPNAGFTTIAPVPPPPQARPAGAARQ